MSALKVLELSVENNQALETFVDVCARDETRSNSEVLCGLST